MDSTTFVPDWLAKFWEAEFGGVEVLANTATTAFQYSTQPAGTVDVAAGVTGDSVSDTDLSQGLTSTLASASGIFSGAEPWLIAAVIIIFLILAIVLLHQIGEVV